jgi:Mn-containing catalase
MKIRTPRDVFFDQLRDLFSVSVQVEATLEDLAKSFAAAPLTEVLLRHRAVVKDQHRLLEDIFRVHREDPGSEICKAIAGLIEGGNEHLAKAAGEARQLILIAHCTRIAHYAIAAFRIAEGMAERLQLPAEQEALAGMLRDQSNWNAELADVARRDFELHLLRM